ncbi:MAG: hypothetical protein FWC41_07850, partial [Firmicutes bacterium]|nr:hypothetical protein [Bacillota bacterium]
MKDIRINKSKISTSIVRLDPTFLKMNFVFFGKIFKKYTKNSEMELYLLEKIPLVFLINKEDNEPLFKAISEILDELRIKKEDKDETNVQNTVVKNRFFEDSENKIFKYSVNNAGNFENFKNFQFVHKKSFNNQHVTEAIKSLVLNIKKNINLKTNDDDRNKDYDENVGQKLIKKSNKLEENVSKIKSKKINYEQKLKVREDKNITKKSQKTIVEDEIVSKKTEDVDINLRDIQLKKITLQLKKINEKIIDRKIKNIRINKIDFDFLNKRNFLSQKINSKLNKVVSSIVFKDQKIKNISKVSSSIVLFHRKFKNLSDIKDIENTVMHHKTKNKKINRIYENINKNQKILKRFLPSVTSFNKKLVINKTNKNKIISYIEESKLKYSNN